MTGSPYWLRCAFQAARNLDSVGLVTPVGGNVVAGALAYSDKGLRNREFRGRGR